MIALTYRLTRSCTGVDESDCRRWYKLPVGSLVFPSASRPDAAGMVEGTCDGGIVKVFAFDLEERAE